MKPIVKNTVVSVAVLSVIMVVCVALLAVANGVFPKPDNTPKLDAQTTALLDEICPGDEYSIFKYGDSLTQFNNLSENAKADRYVTAVYRVEKGANEKCLIVEAAGVGYNGHVIVLTAFEADNVTIKGVAYKKYDAGNDRIKINLVESGKLKQIFDAMRGKKRGEVGTTGRELMSGTSATTSLNGVAASVNCALSYMDFYSGTAETPVKGEYVAESSDEFKALKKVSDAQRFIRYSVKNKHSASVDAVYQGDDGRFIVTGIGDGYAGNTTVMASISDGRAHKLTLISSNEDFAGIGKEEFTEEFNDALFNRLFGGKTLTEISSLSNESLLAGTTGATLHNTARGMIHAVTGAMELLSDEKELVSYAEEADLYFFIKVTDDKALSSLAKIAPSDVYYKYMVPSAYSGKVAAVYSSKEGVVVAEGIGKGYRDGVMSVMLSLKESKVDKIVLTEQNEDFAGVGKSEFGEQFNDELFNRLFSGKSMAELAASDAETLLAGTTGATLVYTPKGMIEAVSNAARFLTETDLGDFGGKTHE